MTPPTDHTGKNFGSWTVLKYIGRQYWECRCKCGAEQEIYSGNLTSGKTTQCRSCGFKKHGMSNSRIYRLWRGLKKRKCELCDLWKDDFKMFYNYSVKHGYTENKFLTRKDESLPIQPGNIVWGKLKGDRAKKPRRLITIGDETKGLSEWARSIGVSRQAFEQRLKVSDDPEYLLSKSRMEKENWYFTFGVGHGNRMFFVRINGTRSSARERMVELFGTIWSFQYSEKEFEGTAERWGYTQHPISFTDEAKS